MGLFNKKQKQQDYIELVRHTVEEAFPDLKGWDIALTRSKSSAIDDLKKAGGYFAKGLAMNIAASFIGMRVTMRDNPFEEIMFITCFKGSEIYFLSIGDGICKTLIEIDPDLCFHFTGNEIAKIKSGFGKKATIQFSDNSNFMFTYGVGAGTIYSLPEGDKQLENFIKAFS